MKICKKSDKTYKHPEAIIGNLYKHGGYPDTVYVCIWLPDKGNFMFNLKDSVFYSFQSTFGYDYDRWEDVTGKYELVEIDD